MIVGPGDDSTAPARSVMGRRAFEAIIWGMPAVNTELLFEAMRKCGGNFNQIVYWSQLLNWKNQTLTPNPDTIYLFAFINTKYVGPVVLEIPPAGDEGSLTGSLDDAWQTAVEDIGPAGIDRGAGGKYLILPPDHAEKVPRGFIGMQSETYASEAFLRSNIRGRSYAEIAQAVAYGKRIRVYPLSQASSPPPTMFVDAFDRKFDTTIPYDIRFFELLDRFVQREPWITRDKAMIDQLKSIGIEQGRVFAPDAETKAILESAAREAHRWLDARYETLFSPSYFDDSNWAVPAPEEVVEGMSRGFARRDSYPVDGRGVMYSFVYFSAKHLGAGQFDLMTISDKEGDPFDGGSAYRLTVPPNVPVKQYWSVAVYDRATHALIRGLPRSSRSSLNPDLRRNPDGSVDIHFGATAPPNADSNWIPTDPAGRFEVLFRLYGPQQALFDRTWKLPSIEKSGTRSRLRTQFATPVTARRRGDREMRAG